MENHQKQPIMVAQKTNIRSAKKGLVIKILAFGIIATAVAIVLFMNTDGSKSRPSTQQEIAAQEEFQKVLIKTQEESQQKMDVARKAAEQTGTHPKWSEAETDSIVNSN